MKMKEKREYKKSELLDMIKDGFYEIENECSDIELGCFGDEDVESFYEFLISGSLSALSFPHQCPTMPFLSYQPLITLHSPYKP